MTSPLREMTEATRRMARGDYRGRVRADSSDEIGELARAFNQMAAELATVDREQRNLVATVSHELRTPLAALTATLENLADGVRPADPEHLGRAVDQAQRVGALVGDLLELSRVEAGVAPLRLGPVRVGALVDEVVADLVPTGRAVRFDVDVPESLEVQADPTRLRQLLTNVLDNAVRHSPEGGRVRVTLRGHRRPVACWTSPTRGRVSRPPTGSARSSGSARWPTPSRARPPAGPGSGLAIARWVATLHSGAIRFADPPARYLRRAAARRPAPRPARRPSAQTHQEAPVPTMPTQPTPPGPPPPPPIYPGHPGSRGRPAPVLDPLFGRFWPDVPGGSRTLVLAAAGVGVLAGLVLPDHSAGLALFLVVVTAGLTVGVRRTTQARPVHPDLPGPRGAVHAAGAAARRTLDRGALPARRRHCPDRRASSGCTGSRSSCWPAWPGRSPGIRGPARGSGAACAT